MDVGNEIRERENLNPVEGGDIYLVPLNMVPADQAGAYSAQGAGEKRTRVLRASDAAAGGSGASRRKISAAYRKLIEDAAGRILRREEADIMRRAEKTTANGDVGGFWSFWMSSIRSILHSIRAICSCFEQSL